MGFFKESDAGTSSKSIARLQSLIWILIYGGLLLLVLGISLKRTNDAPGWTLIVVGGCVAAVGFVLIWVRSRLTETR